MIYCATLAESSVTMVINRIVWDGETPYTYPDPEVVLVQSNIGQIGDKYEDSKFYYWDSLINQWVERLE